MKALRQLGDYTHRRIVMLMLLATCVLLSGPNLAQDAGGGGIGFIPFNPQPVPPLAEGEIKVLDAVIIQVTGRARWRAAEDGPWNPAKIDDILKPGATISTGGKTSVTLRVGHNATLFVDARSRLSLPEFVQDGATLRTRAGLKYGRADFKVEHVGLTNDFHVITPTTTLAVRGTGFGVEVSSLDGVQVHGIRSNMINAIELSYFFRKMRVYISGQGKSSDRHPDPVLAAMHDTLSPPSSWKSALEIVGELDSGFPQDLFGRDIRTIESGNDQQNRVRHDFQDPNTSPPPPGPNPPGQPTDNLFGGFKKSEFFNIAVLICEQQANLFQYFEMELTNSGGFKKQRYNQMVNAVSLICGDINNRNNPLFDIALEVVTYCESLNKTKQQNQCIVDFVNAFTTVYHNTNPPPQGRKKRRKR